MSGAGTGSVRGRAPGSGGDRRRRSPGTIRAPFRSAGSPDGRQDAASSRTRTLSRCRRRTIRVTASICTVGVGPSLTSSTASHTSPRREPLQHHRRIEPARRAAGTERKELHPQLPRALAAVQPPHFAYPHLAVAFGLPLVGVRDLDLHHQVRRDALEPGVGRRLPFGEGREIAPGPLAHVELAVRLHSRTGRLVLLAHPGAAQPPRRAGEDAARGPPRSGRGSRTGRHAGARAPSG